MNRSMITTNYRTWVNEIGFERKEALPTIHFTPNTDFVQYRDHVLIYQTTRTTSNYCRVTYASHKADTHKVFVLALHETKLKKAKQRANDWKKEEWMFWIEEHQTYRVSCGAHLFRTNDRKQPKMNNRGVYKKRVCQSATCKRMKIKQ